MTDVLASFIRKHDLDDEAITILAQLPQDVQAEVCNGFRPKPGTKDVNRLFHNYMRTLLGRAEEAAAASAEPEPAEHTPETIDKCSEWCGDNGLDDACLEALLELGLDDIEKVMNNFAPKAETRDPINLFLSYVRSMKHGPGAGKRSAPAFGMGMTGMGAGVGAMGVSTAPLIEKCTEWCTENGLDQSCLEALLQLRLEDIDKVMNNFKPKADTRNPVSLFLGYCRSMRDGPGAGRVPIGGGGMGMGAMGIGTMGGAMAGGMMGGAMGMGGGMMGGFVGGASASGRIIPPSEMEILLFAQTHALDERCTQMLMEQPPEVQRAAMEEFTPKEGTRDINALFNGFMRSIANRLKGEPKGMGKGAVAYVGKGAPSQTEIYRFAQQWGLDVASTEMMMSYPAEVQRETLNSFCPKADTRDVRSLLAGFMKSIAQKGAAKGFGKGDDMAGMDGMGKGYMGDDGVGLKRPLDGPMDPETFCLMHGFDSEVMAALQVASTEVRDEVMSSFQAKEGTRDPKRLFMGFLKSVQMSGATGKKAKTS
eukprot:gnl/TRDRNA2_/TRDRNA2_136248_c0_seq2.p1 gnl/TRDRNA2_/TRDRNA2_136248_c0~~gnl/TRDRNA2_/TRDRNA2_136248_c0_seq2.p1  ORF type:complete len:556 (+),score=105.81 gnl/TRDRNA2_/TRDRNA2_136248_c0_seq2:61-1668(+)